MTGTFTHVSSLCPYVPDIQFKHPQPGNMI